MNEFDIETKRGKRNYTAKKASIQKERDQKFHIKQRVFDRTTTIMINPKSIFGNNHRFEGKKERS